MNPNKLDVHIDQRALEDFEGRKGVCDVGQWKLEQVDIADPMVAAYQLFKRTKEDRDRLLLGQQAADAEIERLRKRLDDWETSWNQLAEEVASYGRLRVALGKITGRMHQPDNAPEYPGTDQDIIDAVQDLKDQADNPLSAP